MNEMEQEKRASLHADVILRRALDLRTKDNVLIAEFMDLRNTGMSIYEESDYKYHKSWDWLMPVCQQIDKYLEDNISLIGYFDDCLRSNDIDVRYQAVVEFINQLNK